MISNWTRSSLVLRTTVAVFGVTLIVGMLADRLALQVTRTRIRAQQREAMEALLDVVEPSAAAACFVGDQALAAQVVQGLVGTRSVQTATLRSGTEVLARADRDKGGPRTQPATPLVRRLSSPFTPGSTIGELLLVPDPLEAEHQVSRTVTLVRAVVFGLALSLGLTLAFVVHRTITRPIRTLSSRLHKLEATPGAHLSFPTGHEGDEIGQLVRDVNTLVERLVNALSAERKLSEHLDLDMRKVRAILENAGAGIFVVRRDGSMEAWTPAFLRLLNLENAPPPKGVSLPVLFGLEATQVESWLRRCLEEGHRTVETLHIHDFQGQGARWLQLTLDPIGPDWIQGLLDDVTIHHEATNAARELALRDALTGALNRLGIEHAVSERLSKPHPGLGLMLVDLDKFKEVNDTYGHDAGDEVLRQTTIRIEGVLRRTDLVARLGGDEFLLLVDGLIDREIALGIAQKIIIAINDPVPLPEGAMPHVGASIGITLLDPDQQTPWELLFKLADTAMYRAKQAGRNCARVT